MIMIKFNGVYLDLSRSFSMCVDNLAVNQGEILAIIGPNGAGKTTLLNSLALFVQPNRGSIEVFGENILVRKDVLSYRRRLAFIFSDPYLMNDTVVNNVSLPLKLRRQKDPGQVQEMLELFSISHLAGQNALTLSQGQKHRVSLARAFVSQPALLLMDEPFLSLESAYKDELIGELRQFIRKRNITALFVTQQQDEALRLADRIAVMKEGRMLEVGTPQQIFTKPSSKEVADFVGIETVTAGMIVEKEDNLCQVQAGEVRIKAVAEFEIGDKVLVLIRPQDVILTKFRERSSARNILSALITAIEPWGLEYKVTLDCGFSLIAFITWQAKEDLALTIGQKIFAFFKATAIHLLKRQE